VNQNPFLQFQEWLQDAKQHSGMQYANAMALATVDEDGRPSVRIVLLKHLSKSGFQFFTNFEGRKGRELARNTKAGLCFYWDKLGRQVRVEGTVVKLSGAESDAYFASRPRGSQLSAWASKQSSVVTSREVLENAMADLDKKFPGEIPRPDYWGGFELQPSAIEFWTHQDNRLHDRIQYVKEKNGSWLSQRLSP
jgi:pyridoxamine 5'-phosphate oxidase